MFYVFRSGLPQPSDMLISVAVAIYFLFFMAQKKSQISTLAILAIGFGVYTCAVNVVHYFYLPDIVFLKSAFYYIFNVSVMLFVISIFKKNPHGVSKSIYIGLSLAVIIQIFYIHFISSGVSGRVIGTFNNPNQLALWSLLVACIIITLRSRSHLKFQDIVLLLTLGYIQTLSLSKAGIICFSFLMVALPFSSMATRSIKIAYIVLAIFSFLFLIGNAGKFSEFILKIESIDRTVDRLSTIGHEQDESLEGRNYTRIIDYPHFLILGAGEGGYTRFSGPWSNLELHSSLGTILFSYGFLGMGLFLSILFVIVCGHRPYIAFLVFIILLYGLTHQSARFTDFWVFLGAAYGMRYAREVLPEELLGQKAPPKILNNGFSISQ